MTYFDEKSKILQKINSKESFRNYKIFIIFTDFTQFFVKNSKFMKLSKSVQKD